MSVEEAIHLAKRDRIALYFRLAGPALGVVVATIGFSTSSWSSPWIIGSFGFVVIGGALSYHLLTSIVRCPTCSGALANFRVASADAKRKLFSCDRCGTDSWLAEGFYWQNEISG
jgi:hypothetical protein